jgi:hypothetical protein
VNSLDRKVKIATALPISVCSSFNPSAPDEYPEPLIVGSKNVFNPQMK